MIKLLDADWLRSVQLFHQLNCSAINDFAKKKTKWGKAKWRKATQTRRNLLQSNVKHKDSMKYGQKHQILV